MIRLLLAIGIFIGSLANIIGLGYLLYLWGGEGLAFGLAAWSAFKVWISIIIMAIVTVLIGAILGT
jgi:hypothetical protein